jgi:hypothetical protein
MPLCRRIVDNKNSLDCHRIPPFHTPNAGHAIRRGLAAALPYAAVFTCVATAFNKLSLVNGLVRY